MANVPISNLTTTWNNVSTTFTGIKFNVTDTASAAGSLLIDLQIGGSSRFKVDKNSAVTAAGSLTVGSFGNFSLYLLTSQRLIIRSDTGSITFGSADDVVFVRDASNTLAQRNGVNAQTFRLYNTYTDGSNYERGFMRWSSNILQIGTEKAGTGSVRALVIDAGSYIDLKLGGVNKFGIGGSANINYQPMQMSTNHLEFTEQTAPAAPAANNVRIYAEDDGAGKTRLMARFATGAAVQIAIEP